MTSDSVSPPRFDWYAATVNVGVDQLRDVLCRDLSGSAAPEEGARHGFHHREVVRNRAGQTIATILHGGNGDIPHAYASSDHAHGFAEVIRTHWRDRHRVSRMDAALDFDGGPSTWLTLLDLCKSIADGEKDVPGDDRKRKLKIRTNQMGDWHHGKDGRTFYLGAFKSPVLCRLYEKGIQLHQDAARRNLPVPSVPITAVRLEVQVRPDGAAKTTAATATPFEAFGYSEWSRELLRRLNGSQVPRVNVKERRDSDHERAMQWMVKQYEGHLLQEVAALGSWAALGESLRRRLETGSSTTDDDERPF